MTKRKKKVSAVKGITKDVVKDMKKEASPYKTGFFVALMLTALIMLIFIGAAVFINNSMLAIGTIAFALFISYFILVSRLFELLKKNKNLEEDVYNEFR